VNLGATTVFACFAATAWVGATAHAARPKASASQGTKKKQAPKPGSQSTPTKGAAAKAAIKPVSKKRSRQIRRAASTIATFAELSPPQELPAEAIPKRGNYRLRYAGLRSAEPSDHVVWTSITKKAAVGYETTTSVVSTRAPRGRNASKSGTGKTTPIQIASMSSSGGHLLTTAVIANGPGAQARIAELDALADAATAMANEEKVSAHSVQTRFIYVAEEMGLDEAPDVSWVSTRITASELHAIYSKSPGTFDDHDYKVSVPHHLGGKSMEVLLDVPGTLPPRRRVEFAVQNLDLSDALDNPELEAKVSLYVCIQGECANTRLPPGQYKMDEFKVRRRVIAGDTVLRVRASVAHRPRHGTLPNDHGEPIECGDDHNRKCRWFTKRKSFSLAWKSVDLDAATEGDTGWVNYDTRPQQKPKPLSRVLNGPHGSTMTLKASYLASGKKRRR